MNKDALLATLIGFGIGICITGLLLLGPNITKALPKIKLPAISLLKPAEPSLPSVTPTPREFSVTIDSPLADAIENNTDLLISGVTSQGATVVIAGLVDEIVVKAQTDGTYAGKITLIEGKNAIVVTSYDGLKQANQTVSVYYTPENL